MARWKVARGGKKKAGPPRGGPLGCVILMVVALAVVIFSLYFALNPD